MTTVQFPIVVGTYQTSAGMRRHIEEWADATGIAADPLRNVEALKSFLRWNMEFRPGSLKGTVRTLASMMGHQQLPNITEETLQ